MNDVKRRNDIGYLMGTLQIVLNKMSNDNIDSLVTYSLSGIELYKSVQALAKSGPDITRKEVSVDAAISGLSSANLDFMIELGRKYNSDAGMKKIIDEMTGSSADRDKAIATVMSTPPRNESMTASEIGERQRLFLSSETWSNKSDAEAVRIATLPSGGTMFFESGYIKYRSKNGTVSTLGADIDKYDVKITDDSDDDEEEPVQVPFERIPDKKPSGVAFSMNVPNKTYRNMRAPNGHNVIFTPAKIWSDNKAQWASGKMICNGVERVVEKELFDTNGWREIIVNTLDKENV